VVEDFNDQLKGKENKKTDLLMLSIEKEAQRFLQELEKLNDTAAEWGNER